MINTVMYIFLAIMMIGGACAFAIPIFHLGNGKK